MTPDEWKRVGVTMAVGTAFTLGGGLVLMYTDSFPLGFGLIMLGALLSTFLAKRVRREP